MMNFIKKHYIWAAVIVLAVIISGGWIYSRVTKKSTYELTAVQKGELVKEVSVTGRVKAAESVDLAFEKSGRVSYVSVKVGDKVSTGQTLASLSNADLVAQLEQARASLQKEQVELDQLKAGTREEDIQVSRTAVANAQKSLVDTQSEATTDLNNLYDGVREVLTSVYDSADDAVNKQSADLFSNRASINPQLTFYTGSQAEVNAEVGMINAQSALNKTSEAINLLESNRSDQDAALANVNSQMRIVQSALNYFSEALNNAANLTSATLTSYKYNINLGRTNVNTSLTSINSKQQAIAAQKNTNQTAITTAQNTLATAQDQLNLKLAGNTAQDIASQEAQVRYAQANVDSYAAQLGKTIIKSPISGIVTQKNTKVGEIVAANAAVISVLSNAKFEIEANVSENEIAEVSLADPVAITLDALGPSEKFSGRIIKIDPAETIVSGVVYYKVTSVFDVEDVKIKSGMTANLDIQTDKKENVLYLPYYVVKGKNGDKYVQVLVEGKVKEKIIKTGLEGETTIEIIEGLNEGDEVIASK